MHSRLVATHAQSLSQAYARNAILDGADLTNGILDRIDLTDASLKGVKLVNAVITGEEWRQQGMAEALCWGRRLSIVFV